MYQIASNSATIKFSNEEEKQSFNQIAETLQTVANTEFSNSKQVVFALISHCKQLESELETLKTAEIETETTSETAWKQKLIEVIGYDDEPSDEVLVTDILEIIEEAHQPQEPQIKEVEVIKEVEKQLAPNQHIIELSDKQQSLLEIIVRWRHQEAKLDSERMTIPQVIHGMVFNKGALQNDHGQFPTGIYHKSVKSRL